MLPKDLEEMLGTKEEFEWLNMRKKINTLKSSIGSEELDEKLNDERLDNLI